jgi:hypothetical protein
MTIKGALVAASVAGLFAAATPSFAADTTSGKIKCQGVNACAGKGGCKSAANECKGKNGCKGKGWMEITAKECAEQGGKPMK